MPLTTVSPGLLDSNAQYYGFKNRLINGGMVIDQRNAGALISSPANQQFTLDRWQYEASQSGKVNIQQNYGAVTPPAGFRNYLGVVSNSAYSVLAGDTFDIRQRIEGFNVADLAWGTASAQTVTVSFWSRSSLTGTFTGAIQNSAQNRSYPFTYTISSANTWEYKTVTIPGDTSGTWLTDNGVGLTLVFNFGVGSTYAGTPGVWASALYYGATGQTSVVGTNGATFYITGVQLEKGSTATSFDYRPYGTELMLCQRYCKVVRGNENHMGLGFWGSATAPYCLMQQGVQMRSAPTLSFSAVGDIEALNVGVAWRTITSLAISGSEVSEQTVLVFGAVASGGGSQGQASAMRIRSGTGGWVALTAEL